MRLSVFAIFFICPFWLIAQINADSVVWVKLIIYDKVDSSPIENAHIISYKSMQAFASDSLGIFRGYFEERDSLKIFGLGYDALVIRVADFKTMMEGMEIKLARRTYMIRSVDVRAKQELHLHLPDDIKLGKKNETPPPLRNDGFSAKPNVFNALQSPIGVIYYYTSKKERRKRNARKEIAKSKEQDKINLFFNRDIIKEVSRYEEGEELNSFIIYCNVNLKLSSKENPLIVKHKILELKDKFESTVP